MVNDGGKFVRQKLFDQSGRRPYHHVHNEATPSYHQGTCTTTVWYSIQVLGKEESSHWFKNHNTTGS